MTLGGEKAVDNVRLLGLIRSLSLLPALFGSQPLKHTRELAGAIYILESAHKTSNRRIYRAPLLQTTCY
jgi:hypothetical protein